MPPVPRPASTVVVARDAADGGIEILLVERAVQLRFMGGMHVFPGGAVHASDAAAPVAARLARGPIAWPDDHASASDVPAGTASATEWQDAAVRNRAFAVAAVRETCEEVGLLLGVEATQSQVKLVRERLAQDVALAAALEDIAASLDLSALIPLSRWITPAGNPVRFDTRFYIARAPSNQDARADGTESCSTVWRTPAQAIDAHRAGNLVLSPPTHCTLEDIAELSSVNQLLAHATSRPAPCIEPVSAQIDGRKVILFPGDPGHPVRERALRGPTRRPM